MDILGTKVDNFSKKEILKKIRFFLSEPGFYQIVTINPEFILEAQKNSKFKNILNDCDLNIADGFGIKLAFWRLGKRLKCRLTGADLMLDILQIASDEKIEIFLASNRNGLSAWEETRDAILKIYPNLIIDGTNINCHSREGGNPVANHRVFTLDSRLRENDNSEPSYKIPNTSCQILFCNFGAPHQEIFINSQKYANIRLAMGVGGSFDFLTGKVHRAPKFMQTIGLEWLWRLIQQPKRWKRIFNAVVIFPIKVIFNK